MENPYIEQARVFIYEDEKEPFVIAHMRIAHRYNTPEDPTFLHNNSLQPKPKVARLVGFEEEGERMLLYHAESSEQAEAIRKLFLEGKGYSINGFSVPFESAPNPLPSELEGIADSVIKKYRDIVGARIGGFFSEGVICGARERGFFLNYR